MRTSRCASSRSSESLLSPAVEAQAHSTSFIHQSNSLSTMNITPALLAQLLGAHRFMPELTETLRGFRFIRHEGNTSEVLPFQKRMSQGRTGESKCCCMLLVRSPAQHLVQSMSTPSDQQSSKDGLITNLGLSGTMLCIMATTITGTSRSGSL